VVAVSLAKRNWSMTSFSREVKDDQAAGRFVLVS
jgi:hypothetical protein